MLASCERLLRVTEETVERRGDGSRGMVVNRRGSRKGAMSSAPRARRRQRLTKEDDELRENEVLDWNVCSAVGNGHDEGLKVLRL